MPAEGSMSNLLSPTATRPNCAFCPASARCAMGELEPEALAHWNGLGQCHQSLEANGKALFEAFDPMDALFIVRAGCVKTVTVDDQGNERVRGFHLAGDLLGLDALGAERYPCTAIAVSAAQVCRIPKAVAMQRIATSPLLAQRLLERMSRELAHAQALAGDYSAEQRVAAFLMNMNQRLNPMAGGVAKLPMSRGDIASYLRLATETVCRVMTRFAAKGFIHAEDRKLRILEPLRLTLIAAPVGLATPELPVAA